jgi:hypothetical protein
MIWLQSVCMDRSFILPMWGCDFWYSYPILYFTFWKVKYSRITLLIHLGSWFLSHKISDERWWSGSSGKCACAASMRPWVQTPVLPKKKKKTDFWWYKNAESKRQLSLLQWPIYNWIIPQSKIFTTVMFKSYPS